MHEEIADAKQRRVALDPEDSFIVQAPAGSGKTELLIQRYLKLLAAVQSPEEIIAITFTRKAAAEMRGRILKALARAADDDPPEREHEHTTWELARDALKQDAKQQWHLPENPSRLRIQTIDSLSAGLTRQMPLVSGFGAQPGITDQPDALYREAAKNTVAELESGAMWSPSVEALIRHLDNDLKRVEGLIARMLAQRDQWLRHVVDASGGQGQRQALENALQCLISDALKAVRNRFPASGMDEVLSLARFAAENLEKANPESPICACKDMAGLPGTTPGDLAKWLGLRELLMTQRGDWRKACNKNTGFPAPSDVKGDSSLKALYKARKDAFKSCIEGLSREKNLETALHEVKWLPEGRYTDAQWDIMGALFEILKVAAGHLQVAFQAAGEVDFAEVALRAAAALGDEQNPTDLALSLDYGIQHILMDEFQDTSFTQFELIEKLVAGWTPGDGRTFFAVGDPMQSIYGFRQAEVGLFLRAWEQGLGTINLKQIRLSVNFRSQKGIVDWVNTAFPRVMPDIADETTGAVVYAPSVAFHPGLTGEAVQIHPFIPYDRDGEADAVVACVNQARQLDPGGSIAILVRSRPHLEAILPRLRAAGISFRAVEIESLKQRAAISDVMSLARAVSHPADRIAWLSVLRAPWCGLTLADLHTLAGYDTDRTIPDLMEDADRTAGLSPDGRTRLESTKKILLEAVAQRNLQPLSRLVEAVWVSLGGPACVFAESDLEDVRVFLDLLDRQVASGLLTDVDALEAATAELFARPDTKADESLQVMTIHKAKGLEFDTVILPGLDRKPPYMEPRLLLWLERYAQARRDLLLAPISETGTGRDKIYDYIKGLIAKKGLFEDARLLYVACTRAKKRLHLLGGASISDSGDRLVPPAKTSLLRSLWPAVEEEFQQLFDGMAPVDDKPAEDENRPPPVTAPFIRRFPTNWSLPDPPADAALKTAPGLKPETKKVREIPRFDWAGETVRQVGIVVHRWLKVICEDGVAGWDADRVRGLSSLFEVDLVCSGVLPEGLKRAIGQVETALVNAVTDERGRWILAKHGGDACEYALTGRIDSEIISAVIDRTFIDEQGIRWIIDYKTGIHAGGSVEEFLDREKIRYRAQLENYAALMAEREDAPVRLGLYFPQLKGWREW